MTDTIVRIEPAMPCSTIEGDRLCRKPATIAFISSIGLGRYIMQPICRDCVAGMARIYLPELESPGNLVKPGDDAGAV